MNFLFGSLWKKRKWWWENAAHINSLIWWRAFYHGHNRFDVEVLIGMCTECSHKSLSSLFWLKCMNKALCHNVISNNNDVFWKQEVVLLFWFQFEKGEKPNHMIRRTLTTLDLNHLNTVSVWNKRQYKETTDKSYLLFEHTSKSTHMLTKILKLVAGKFGPEQTEIILVYRHEFRHTETCPSS